MRKEWAIGGLLVLAVAGVFGQSLRHEFVNYDDVKYILRNPPVRDGLTARTVAWAFTARDAGNWHPLTWLSHAADCQLFGQAAWGHHLIGVMLHAAAAVLLFLVLHRMTGDFWPAAFVAAVWAVHPLRVESVVWAAERKDVLSGLFFMLALAAYLGYARRPFSWIRYSAVVAAMALGLMAKPMLVTLPLVLLLLDYWPLKRSSTFGLRRLAAAFVSGGVTTLPLSEQKRRQAAAIQNSDTGGRRFLWLLIEKITLFLLAAAACAVTLWAQSDAIADAAPVALPWRIGNAAVSCVAYLAQTFWPADLAVLYPHPGDRLPTWQIAAAAALLAAICTIVIILRRKAPFLLVGWLWYLVMLLPVVGLIQVGNQARADRYTYLPQIGLWIAIAWSAAGIVESRARLGRHFGAAGGAAGAILVILAIVAWRQTSFWRDSETLWRHTIRCTGRNPVAHYNFGEALSARGRIDEAVAEYRRAIDEKPDYPEACYNLGVLLVERGEIDEAVRQYRAALRAAPDLSEAHCNLGAILADRGFYDEAIEHYRAALKIMPDFAEVHNNLGNVELRLGRVAEAVSHYEEALRVMPDYADAHGNLGVALLGCGRFDAAIVHFRRVLALQPDNENARRNLEAALRGSRASR